MATTAGSDNVIAKPSDTCCMTGHIREGEARGTHKTIADLDTYISEPAEGNANGHVLLWYPDVWGFSINNFGIMDGFADAGFLTIGIDYFRGDGVQKHRGIEPDFDFEKWTMGHKKFADEVVPKWTSEVKSQYAKDGRRFACVGYCFGAPYVCELMADGGPCDVGGFAHPAFLKDSHFSNLTKPLFLSCAEDDFTFPNEFRNKAVDILQAEKKRFQVQLFSGVSHGFALRGDNSPYAKYVKEQSLKGLADYFSFWLGQE